MSRYNLRRPLRTNRELTEEEAELERFYHNRNSDTDNTSASDDDVSDSSDDDGTTMIDHSDFDTGGNNGANILQLQKKF